jgi:uncharacterized membrane protein YdfJ with MMPL/SSD domain
LTRVEKVLPDRFVNLTLMTFASTKTCGVDRFFDRLGRFQARRPALFVLLGLAATAALAMSARGLELRPSFDQLLPEGEPSVVELRRVLLHVAGTGRIFVVLEGDDAVALRETADRLVPLLRAVGPPWVGSVEAGVQRARNFLMPRAGLFATVAQIHELQSAVDARLGFADFADEPLDPAKSLSGALEDPFPTGYFEAKDGKALLVVVRSAVAPGDLDAQREALRRVQGQVATALPAGVRAGYAGDLVTGLYEYGAALRDLFEVGALGIGLVLASIVLFYGRLRPLLAMAITLAAGLAGSFAFARIAVGHLNVASGFLFSIIAGNGINPAIIYQARYLEERARGSPIEQSTADALRETWLGTFAAALAAAGAYGALGVTRFRGFRDFALIGAAGMLICWLMTVLLLPAVLAGFDRLRPFQERGLLSRLGIPTLRYEAPFVAAVTRAPRALIALGAILAVAGAALTARWLIRDPFEYDLGKLQSSRSTDTELYRVSALAASVLGTGREGAMVILCDRPDEVPLVRAALISRRGEKPAFGGIRTLQDYVPDDQETKIPLLLALRQKLLKAKALIPAREWTRISPWLPPADLRPIGLYDLPDDLAAAFTERDGTRGRLIFVEPAPGESDRDLRYLVRWSDSFRETRLPSGELVRGSGSAVLFADMLRLVATDTPRALAAALAVVTIAVVAALGAGRAAVLALGSLAVGLVWLGGLLSLLGVRIHFLNFMAFPITLGVGLDYAVNLLQREQRDGALAALRNSGGAIILCSITTTLGYIALLRSINQGVASLGLIAALGEMCVLVAAVALLPAVLTRR